MSGPDKLIAQIERDWNLPPLNYDDDQKRSLIKIAASVSELYRRDDAISDWLTTPCPMLDWKSPLEVLTAREFKKVEQYADYLSGR